MGMNWEVFPFYFLLVYLSLEGCMRNNNTELLSSTQGSTNNLWIMLLIRFSKVAELVDGPWLEIYGTLETKILSRETMYGVHLVFSIVERSRGLDRFHKATVKLGGNVSHRVGRFRGRKRKQPSSNGNLAVVEVMEPHRRPDGWMEIEIGEFYTRDGDDGEVKMCVVDNNARHISGLIVHGIDIRPKC